MAKTQSSTAASPGLLPNSLRFLGTLGNSIGIQAPTAGVTFLPALMAGVVGGAGPVAFLFALGAMLFVGYAFTLFARDTASAGSVFAFNGKALTPFAGFTTLCLLLLVYIAYASSVLASNANLVQGRFPHAPWVLLALVCLAVSIVIGYRHIGLSAALIVVFEAVSLVLVGIVAVAVLVHGSSHHHVLLLHHSSSPSLSTLGLGVVLAFTGFSGFEVAATLGEESSRPKRVIPRAFIVALIASGLIYAGMSWIETIAFPTPASLASQSVPLVTIAHRYIGAPMAILINLAALVSGLGAQFACFTGATRLLYAIAREVAPNSVLARTHHSHHSPTGALWTVAAFSLLGIVVLASQSAIDAYFDLATFGADLILIVYLVTIVGAISWSIRRRIHPVMNSLILGMGALILGGVIWSTLTTLVAPFTWCALAAGVVVLGCAVAYPLLPRVRNTVRASQLLMQTNDGL